MTVRRGRRVERRKAIHFKALALIILALIAIAFASVAWKYAAAVTEITHRTAEVSQMNKAIHARLAQVQIDKKNAQEEAKRKRIEIIKLHTTNPAMIEVVVNKKYPLKPSSYVPADLVTWGDTTLSSRAMDSFKKMSSDAAAAGQAFRVTSSYRSYGEQITTYNYWIGLSGQAVADTYSARPGFSEHQTGLVVDVAAGGCVLDCFGSTSQYQWLRKHAANYGFIQRYKAGSEAVTGYTSEEWHYRYVGRTIALDMQSKGIATLEEYWGIQGGDYR